MQIERPENLTFNDCILLAPVFEQELLRLFPLPVSVTLHISGDSLSPLVPQDIPLKLQQNVSATIAAAQPRYDAGILYVPLTLAGGHTAVFALSDADPSLLQKFSSSWLLEFQETVLQHMQLVRQIYLDPETGLYNQRALKFFLQYSPEVQSHYSLYIVSTFFIRRSTNAGFRKIQYLAGFFSAISQGVLFFLGQGVFALLVTGKKRDKRLALAHYLQRRLKREGLQKVHVAFTDFQKGNEYIYDEIFQALAVAERRGPFGLCDADALQNAEKLPFALPEDKFLRRLQKLWRGVDRFGLVLFQGDKEDKSPEPFDVFLTSLLQGQEQALVLSPNKVFVFIPNASAIFVESRVQELARDLKGGQQGSVSVGACCFPCLQYTKTAMIRNCQKAIMHGAFYGPGSVVFFDSLSLNVSGDWYFDEGDFRQAVQEYSQGLKLQPGESNLLNSLGVALIEMNRTHQAIASFTKVLEKDTDNYMALVNLGYAYQMQGRDEPALEYFEKAFAVQYHSGISGTDIYQQLSRLYCRAGQYEKALPVLELWQKDQEGEAEFTLYRLLGQAYAETGQSMEAMKSLQRALQLYPHDLVSMSMLGLLYVEQGEGADAGILLLEKALSIDDTQADSWYRLARANMQLHKTKEALDGVRRCLQLKRGHIPATILLGKILSASGKKKQAAAALHRILEMKEAGTAEKRAAEKAIATLLDD